MRYRLADYYFAAAPCAFHAFERCHARRVAAKSRGANRLSVSFRIFKYAPTSSPSGRAFAYIEGIVLTAAHTTHHATMLYWATSRRRVP